MSDSYPSLWILIDGYNVVGPVAPPSRDADSNWLQRERMLLINRLVQHLDAEARSRTCVVFDAASPPRDRADEFEVEGIHIRFAVGYPEADDLLEQLISEHSAPKNLVVVSSDHRVQAAARRRGALAFDSQQWLDDFLDGKVRLAITRDFGAGQGGAESEHPKTSSGIDSDDVDEWLRKFGF